MKMAVSSPKRVENTVGKEISPFPKVFKKKKRYCRHEKNRACLEKGMIIITLKSKSCSVSTTFVMKRLTKPLYYKSGSNNVL